GQGPRDPHHPGLFSSGGVPLAPRGGRFRGETGDRNTQQCGSSVTRRDRRETTWPQTTRAIQRQGCKISRRSDSAEGVESWWIRWQRGVFEGKNRWQTSGRTLPVRGESNGFVRRSWGQISGRAFLSLGVISIFMRQSFPTI